jgi:hypothetical protein
VTPVRTASAGDQSAGGYRVADAGDVRLKQQKSKADFERKRAENMRKFEQKTREMKADHDRRRTQSHQDFVKAREEMRAASQPLPFDVASAPPPDKWVQSYIAAAKSGSMEQLMQYLPQARQKALKKEQASYDPKVAAKRRETHRKQSPHLDEESLDHLTGPPYARALKFHKEIADKILEVLSFSIDGNKAYVSVSTTSGGTINGVHYPYGTAKFGLVGEGSFWRLETYKDSITVYKYPPKPE